MRPELHKTTLAGESEGCYSLCSMKHDQSYREVAICTEFRQFGKMSIGFNLNFINPMRANVLFIQKSEFSGVSDQLASTGFCFYL